MRSSITKLLFSFAFMLAAQACLANMASPIREGSRTGSLFLSNYASVLQEDILIRPDKDFRTAFFEIKYKVNLEKDGLQIPVLFYAIDFQDSFELSIDGTPISLKQIPDTFSRLAGTFLSDFSQLFGKGEASTNFTLELNESESEIFQLHLRDLKYFETDLDSGEHIIRISYTATVWEDLGPWIKEQEFRYLLSPAKYWRSFGTLNIKLDPSLLKQELLLNLAGSESSISSDGTEWKFNSLPGDMLRLSRDLYPTEKANFLLKLGPWGIAFCLIIPLLILHLFFLIKSKRANHKMAYRIFLFVGGAILPLLLIAAYLFSYVIIDNSLGDLASGRHTYAFLSLGLWPFLTLGYVLFCWVIGRFLVKPRL